MKATYFQLALMAITGVLHLYLSTLSVVSENILMIVNRRANK